MAKNKESFILYSNIIHTISKLSDEQSGKLFKIILEYVNDKDPVVDDLLLQIAFEPIKQKLKEDLKKWEAICKRNSDNGLKGGRPKKPKKPTGLIGNPKKPKKADSECDSEYDNEDENENVKVDYNKFIETWNPRCRNIPKIATMSDTRKAKLRAIAKEFGAEKTKYAMQNLFNSEFCQGQNNTNWVANVDWFLKRDNFIKCLENNYKNN